MSARLRATPWFRRPTLPMDWKPYRIDVPETWLDVERSQYPQLRSNIHARPRTLTWAMLYEAAYGPMVRVLFEPLRGTPLYPFDR